MKITVHHFKVYDPISDSWIVPSRKSPSERIQDIHGIIIPGTAQDVERSALDEEGRFDARGAAHERASRVLN